ncbi:MAG: TetR/AcrR family transcriptional regulator [Pirellulales bacterium]|nr:TetR/AcrR family transcriptional regulator [Pirellulales bacterium]
MAGPNGSLSEDPGKRQAILEQSIRCFAELGFRGTDVQQIADRAGVGKGTVYRYFHSKEDLFWATTLDVFWRLEKVTNEAQERVEGACAKIRAAALAYAEFFESNPLCLEVFIQERAEFRGDAPELHREYHKKLIARFEQVLQDGIASGELRSVDTYKTVHAIGSLLYGTVVFGGHLTELSPIEMAKHNIDTFLRGIRSKESLAAETEFVTGSREQ